MEGLIDFTIEHFGQLDVCCLNSGGVQNTAPVAQMTDEEWTLEIDWNLNHVFWGMRRALKHMIPRELRPDHRHLVGRGQARQAGHPRLRHDEARGQRAGEVGGARGRHARHHRQRRAARDHRDRHRPRDRARTRRSPWASASYDEMIAAVHARVGDQAAEHGRGGRRRRRAAGLATRPATSPAACSRSTAARCRTRWSASGRPARASCGPKRMGLRPTVPPGRSRRGGGRGCRGPSSSPRSARPSAP